nr:protein S100-A13-like isoform X2 [Geotrypetes seraphini]
MATGATELENSIKNIVCIFFDYAEKEGKANTLSKAEFTKLVKEQLPNLMKDAGPLDEKLKALDVNHDQEIKFSEYWTLIGEMGKGIKRETWGKKK